MQLTITKGPVIAALITLTIGSGGGFFVGYEVEREHVIHALTNGLTQVQKETQKVAVPKEKPQTPQEISTWEHEIKAEEQRDTLQQLYERHQPVEERCSGGKWQEATGLICSNGKASSLIRRGPNGVVSTP